MQVYNALILWMICVITIIVLVLQWTSIICNEVKSLISSLLILFFSKKKLIIMQELVIYVIVLK